jgi:hypothetical protein
MPHEFVGAVATGPPPDAASSMAPGNSASRVVPSLSNFLGVFRDFLPLFVKVARTWTTQQLSTSRLVLERRQAGRRQRSNVRCIW